jgi:hypothetical protein
MLDGAVIENLVKNMSHPMKVWFHLLFVYLWSNGQQVTEHIDRK